MNNLLVLETSSGHNELFYSYEKIFGDEAQVFFGIKDQKMAKSYGIKESQIHQISGFSLSQAIKLSHFIKANNITDVIFNSCSGGRVFRFILFLKLFCYLRGVKLKIYGILHDAHKLKTSSSQRAIARVIDGFYVISRLIESYVKKNFPAVKVAYFYPSFFSGVERAEVPFEPELRIAIVGRLENKRRDYPFLLKTAQKMRDSGVEDVKFILAGSAATLDGKEFISQVNVLNLSKYFEIYEARIETQDLFRLVSSCHYVALLQHENTPYSQYYLESKSTGAANVSIAFELPLLVHNFLEPSGEYQGFSVFYDESNFLSLLPKLKDPETYNNLRHQIAADDRFSLEGARLRIRGTARQ